MSLAEKAIEKAQRSAQEIAAAYNVPLSAIVWAGGNKYMIAQNGSTVIVYH